MPSRKQAEYDQNSKKEIHRRLLSARGALAGKSRAYNRQKKLAEEWRVAAEFVGAMTHKLQKSARKFGYLRGQMDGYNEGISTGLILGASGVFIVWLATVLL